MERKQLDNGMVSERVNRLFAAGVEGERLEEGCAMLIDLARQGLDAEVADYIVAAQIAAGEH
jgi:hypothetical protein